MAFGSSTAGPIVKEIMNDSLKYLGVEPKYTEEEKKEFEKEKVKVPNIIDLSIEDALKVLEENKLKPLQDVDTELKGSAKVVDIFPKPGADVPIDSGIVLYTEN